MPRKNDEIVKGIVDQMGTLIDARNKTLEINLKAHVNESIKASEERIRKDMATKDDLKKLEEKMATKDEFKKLEEKMATKDEFKKLEEKMATKDDIKRLEQKIDKTTELQRELDMLKERVKTLEENARIRN